MKKTPAESRDLKRYLNKEEWASNDTRLDRIRRYYFETGYSLSDADEAYRRILEQVNQKLCAGYSQGQVVKMLQKDGELELKAEKSRTVVRDAMELFGDISDASRKGLRNVLTEQYMLLASIARENEDLESWRRALDSMGKINNLAGIEDDVKKKVRRISVTYTTDAGILKKQAEEESYG